MPAKKIKVLFAASEAYPFAKTGGLADVAGSLPQYLHKEKVDARLIMPKYKTVYDQDVDTEILGEFSVNLAGNVYLATLEKGYFPGKKVPVYFIKNDRFFFRDNFYQVNGKGYEDNASRFVFFSRACLEALKFIEFKPDIIHCHDWQTGLIPCYLNSKLYCNDEAYSDIKTLFTIHNLAYQGLFWHLDMPLLSLGWEYFTPDKIEFYGKISFMKAGIVYADVISTVSPSYAKEIQTKEFGCGLESILALREESLTGIINGIDGKTWNPAKDKLIPKNYTVEKIKGKMVCKKKLLKELGLKDDTRALVGFVGRLVEQKGIDLILSSVEEMAAEGVNMVFLGTGEKEYEEQLLRLQKKYPENISVRIEYNEELAHWIYAGSDIFLMPSKFEPCGLNQLYALRYGAIPVVRKTGGLNDTIIGFDSADGKGNGFSFESYDKESLLRELKKAFEVYQAPKLWKKLTVNAMYSEFTWEKSAQEYQRLYKKLLKENSKRETKTKTMEK